MCYYICLMDVVRLSFIRQRIVDEFLAVPICRTDRRRAGEYERFIGLGG